MFKLFFALQHEHVCHPTLKFSKEILYTGNICIYHMSFCYKGYYIALFIFSPFPAVYSGSFVIIYQLKTNILHLDADVELYSSCMNYK